MVLVSGAGRHRRPSTCVALVIPQSGRSGAVARAWCQGFDIAPSGAVSDEFGYKAWLFWALIGWLWDCWAATNDYIRYTKLLYSFTEAMV